MIDLTKNYETVDGRKVENLQFMDSLEEFQLVGIVEGSLFRWTKDGKYFTYKNSDNDLVEINPHKKYLDGSNTKPIEVKIQDRKITIDKFGYMVINLNDIHTMTREISFQRTLKFLKTAVDISIKRAEKSNIFMEDVFTIEQKEDDDDDSC